MYARCPACNVQFRVRAAHLKAARGYVRCGACGHAFDALDRLSDAPVAAPLPARPGEEPEFKIPTEPGLGVAVAGIGEPDLPAGLRGREADEPVDELLRAPDIRHDDDGMGTERWLQRQSSPRGTRIWTVAAALLLVAGAAQVSWFNRDIIYNYYPQVLPWMEQVCAHLGCEVYRERRPDAIELLDRDVRVHPVYENTLLVNATIANRAGRRQPYPEIELALYDTGGQAIAYRRFAPRDYLDGSLPIATGMAPDTPLHVVLEISGPTVDAVSFEFGFL